MYISNVLSLLPILGLAKAAALPEYSAPAPEVDESTVYYAIVVGGGPSGLSAVSGLARVRRNVLLIDSGEYRNNATRHMHDVIGMDGNISCYPCQSRDSILTSTQALLRLTTAGLRGN